MLGSGLNRFIAKFDRRALVREVEEELQLHIEMRAQEYENEGLTREEAQAKARVRFGDFAQVKSECLEIGMRNSVAMGIQKGLFTIAFGLGVFIRSLDAEFRVTRIGDVLMMIGVFGGLLMLGKRIKKFNTTSKPIRLGLNDGPGSIPVAFDADGHTPFERVRAADGG